LKKLLLIMFSVIALISTSACHLKGNSSNVEEVITNQLPNLSKEKTDKSFEVKKILKVHKDFAFVLSKTDNILFVDLKKKGNSWEVEGVSGGINIEDLNVNKDGISLNVNSSNDKVLYGLYNNSLINQVNYKPLNLDAEVINLPDLKNNKSTYKNLKLWYLVAPENDKLTLDELNNVTFKEEDKTLKPYK
jgi:hypothetical protein